MGSVLQFSKPMSVEEAWNVYKALFEEQQANPALRGDRQHQEKMLRAHKAWAKLFEQLDEGR